MSISVAFNWSSEIEIEVSFLDTIELNVRKSVVAIATAIIFETMCQHKSIGDRIHTHAPKPDADTITIWSKLYTWV